MTTKSNIDNKSKLTLINNCYRVKGSDRLLERAEQSRVPFNALADYFFEEERFGGQPPHAEEALRAFAHSERFGGFSGKSHLGGYDIDSISITGDAKRDLRVVVVQEANGCFIGSVERHTVYRVSTDDAVEIENYRYYGSIMKSFSPNALIRTFASRVHDAIASRRYIEKTHRGRMTFGKSDVLEFARVERASCQMA